MSHILKGMTDARSTLDNQSDVLIEIDENTREKLKKAILDMYKDVYEVCRRHDIIPYLIGGSALGAVRHQGFIPWDDDIDIGMTREDYGKFVGIFERELGDRYVINAPNVSVKPKARFTKIFKKGTVCREVFDSKDSLNGIFLDVFIIENVPRNPLVRKIKGMYCNALQFISSQVYLYEQDNPVLEELYSGDGKENYNSRKRIGKFFSFRSSVKWFDSVDKAVQYKKKTGLYGIATGRKHYLGEIFEEDVFFPVQYRKFEDIEAPLFNNLDVYLRNLYHDYMQLPPEDKRERHYVVELKFEENV
ncbi:MAG: LicD family protein [Lachnospiraceae bacterium]|nr:LicD family protein [Lachnospiraceae bacterium]